MVLYPHTPISSQHSVNGCFCLTALKNDAAHEKYMESGGDLKKIVARISKVIAPLRTMMGFMQRMRSTGAFNAARN